LVVGIQLLLWTAGGLFFSLNPIAKVRGETEEPELPPLEFGTPPASPAAALTELVRLHSKADIQTVALRPHLGGAIYEITFLENGEPHWALADVSTGELRAAIDRDEAIAIAKGAYLPESPIADITLVTEATRGSEYRERPVPAFRVTFDDPLGTRLYISVERGVVTARRNDRWRLFDFLWMLHIMDYQTRDNFNTFLLQAVSALGLVTVLSGFILAVATSPRLRRTTKRR
ncbi:MAG: hypothetical protein MUP13_06575, partial [Thermoanaerobaculales bacterium]|nr:hypothetical protein [Thermoanaerobaculales bacterium]